MHPVECNVCPVKCNIYPVESNIDVGHLKFPLGLILTTILTPKVKKNEVLAVTNWKASKVLAVTNERQTKCWQRLIKMMAIIGSQLAIIGKMSSLKNKKNSETFKHKTINSYRLA